MSMQTVIHSNAFNFMSFVQGSVDARTGQYGLGIDLPGLPANDLCGPDLPLRLAFNPLNNRDSGFGTGWNLVLSQFRISTGMLDLHSGEAFQVVDNGPGQQALVPERKVESFHFRNVSEGQRKRFRIAHKSGLVEILEPQQGDDDLALPTRILAPSGHGITLAYKPYKHGACLESIVDDASRALLWIDYAGNDHVSITLHPNTQQAALYTLEFSGDRLSKIVLPSEDKGRWAFAYKPVEYAPGNTLHLLERVDNPSGGVELVQYREQGHGLPGSSGRSLPYVSQHVVQPGNGQPEMKLGYTFSASNFLGFGSGIEWDDNGRDNLYKVADPTYQYESTVSHYLDDKVARTVKRTFNRFHLLTQEVTTEQRCIRTTVTKYHELPNKQFAEQPAYFQLPHTVTDSWAIENNSVDFRQEEHATIFDGFGNLTEECQPNGTRTVQEYYPQAQDPEGFVRNVKQRTVHPAQGAGIEEGAPTLATFYRYKVLPGLGESAGWLVKDLEQECRLLADEQRAELRSVDYLYHEDPLDPLRYGRLQQQVSTMNGLATIIDFDYLSLVVDGHPVVQTCQTVTGHDHGEALPEGGERHSRKIVTLQDSALFGEPLLSRDDNDVEIRYEYDRLRRVTRETVAPDTQYAASRQYAYVLVAIPGNQATQTRVDVKGVATLSIVDGLNRVTEERRQDPDFGDTPARQRAFRQTYAARYDGLGNLIEETEVDWHRLADVPLPHAYHYDGWGSRCSEVGPDGVVHHDQTDPIGAPHYRGPVRREWRESADGSLKSGQTVTWMNAFGTADQVERIDTQARPVSRHQYFYDGLGRSVREVSPSNDETRFAYDEFDRLVDNRLPDHAVVHREYALHSQEDLPVRIEVRLLENDQLRTSVLGHQRFDGLGRMVESITGGRVRTYHFDPGQRQPSHVLTPRGERIDYTYLPQLGEEPLSRALTKEGIHASYVYDEQNARLKSCAEQDVLLTREYFSTGEVKLEKRQHGAEAAYEMNYVYSRNASLLSYTDVLGNEQVYRYDSAGRLESTELGALLSEFTYDPLGRMETIHTQDLQAGHSLKISLVHDDFDRETERSFDFGASGQVLSQDYDADDRITCKRLTEGELTLREEHFEYDERGRLLDYTCTGDVDFMPVDPYGNTIEAQAFRFDTVDNITRVRTLHSEGRVTVDYHFENPEDPAQLSGFTITGLDPQPREVLLAYDPDGNLIVDEQGRRLDYDALGRLVRVSDVGGVPLADYGYDPLDRLVAQQSG